MIRYLLSLHRLNVLRARPSTVSGDASTTSQQQTDGVQHRDTGEPAGTEEERHPRPRRLQMPLFGMLYIIIGVLAVLTRFWDLSSRAMNHDESLHTYFSWLYYSDYSYIHDPLMHGPALFHGNALAYLLFGDNDYTSRIVPALLGVLIVLMPAMLRSPGYLGRWGALACSSILLVSPSILYYSRFIRHDVYTLFATFAIVIAALRYMERPERRWLVLAGAMTGFLFTTKEVSFIVAFVIVTFLLFVVTWQIHRALLGVLLGTGAALLVTILGMQSMGVAPFPTIPWEDPTSANIRDFSFSLARHPVVLAGLGIIGLGLVAATMVLDRIRDRRGRGWLESTLGRTDGHTTAHTLYRALRDRRGLQIAVLAGLGIFIVLYTSLFTNLAGLASATFGALGYWLGQQDVQRGSQPWFYYLIMLPQYEFIAVVTLPVTAVITVKRLVPGIRSGEPVGRRNYFRGFVLYWAVVMLVVLTWAGEKMPWLVVHVALPLTILAASFAGEAIEWIETRWREGRLPRRSTLLTMAGVPLVAGFGFLLWSWGTAGPWMRIDEQWSRGLQPTVSDIPWLLYIPLLAFVGLIVFALTKLGWRGALATVGIASIGVMLLGQMHVSYRFTYEEGDVPRDMLMYSQVSPDVTRVVEEVGLLSRQLTGGKDMRIMYDSGTSWPFQWYLRDYPNRSFFGTELSNPPDAPIVLIATENLRATDSEGNVTTDNEALLTGYTHQEYTMRWFYPEVTTYRNFAIAPELNDEFRQNYQTDEPGPYGAVDVAASVWSSFWSLRDPEQQADVFRLVAFRELPEPVIGSYNFRVYVRNDLTNVYNQIRY